MSTSILTAGDLSHRDLRSLRIAPASLLFSAILLFVGGVSLYDGYLVLRTGDEICEYEKNPAGVWLLACNHGNPTLFLTAKGVGTAIVLASMTVLYRRSQRLALPVAYALCLFQAGLLLFLERA
jgi:hypothetical protein